MIESVVKMVVILSVCVSANFKSCSVYGQKSSRKSPITYLGFDVAFGTRSFKLNSNLERINGMNVLEEGGSAGFLMGNKIWQAKLRQGFFYSSGIVPYSTDLIETELNVNVNPMQLIKARFRMFEPYLTGGIERNAIKFYGSYVGKDRTGDAEIRSSSTQPYLGQIVVTRGSLGAGLQYRIPYRHAFLRLFAETRYGYKLTTGARSKWFNHTDVSGQLAVNVGVCFGYLNVAEN